MRTAAFHPTATPNQAAVADSNSFAKADGALKHARDAHFKERDANRASGHAGRYTVRNEYVRCAKDDSASTRCAEDMPRMTNTKGDAKADRLLGSVWNVMLVAACAVLAALA